MVGQWTLDPLIGVRIPAPQPPYLPTLQNRYPTFVN